MRFSFYLPKNNSLTSNLKTKQTIKIPLRLMAIPFNVEVEYFQEKTVTLFYKKNEKHLNQLSLRNLSVKNINIKHKKQILAQKNFKEIPNSFSINEERTAEKVLFNNSFDEPFFDFGVQFEKDEIIFKRLKFFPYEKNLDFVVETLTKEDLFYQIDEIRFLGKIFKVEKVEDSKIFSLYLQ